MKSRLAAANASPRETNVVDGIIGNWQLNGIFTIRSGQRYSVITSNDQANTGNAGWPAFEQANLVGDANSGSCPGGAKVHTQTCWFNTDTFELPAKGTFGNVRPDGFQSQRYWNVDFSIFRQFPLWSENRRLEFRAETFNLFNRSSSAHPTMI